MLSRYILGAILLILSTQSSLAVECSAVFTDGLQTHGNGSISFQQGAMLKFSPDNILDTTNLNDNSGNNNYSCDTVNCTSSGNSADVSSFSDFNGSNNDITINDNEDYSLAPGEYNKVSLGNNVTLRLSEGEYILNQTIEFGNNSKVIITSGVVQLFTKQSVNFNNGSEINLDGDATQLLVYSEQNIEVSSTVKGFLYSEQSTNLQNNSLVQGAINGAQVNLQNNATVEYSNNIPDFGDFCEGTPVDPVVDYCETTFVNGLTTYADGEIRILGDGERTIFNDRNGLLRTDNLNDDDDELICEDIVSSGSTQVCARDTVNEDTVPLADIPFISGSGGSNISDVATAITLGSGSYNTDTFDNITVNDGGNITFSSDYSTYYIDKLEVLGDNSNGTSATITFAPGDYYINEFDTFQNTTILSSGTVRIIIQQSSEFRGNTQINVGGAPADFLIYNGDDDIRLYDSTEVHALLYAENTVGFNESNESSTVRLVGAASAGERINLGENTEVYYTCDPYIEPVVTATTEYRFDELLYAEVDDEVKDSIGNAHGKAISSQPVEGKVCNAIDLSDTGISDYAILDNTVLDKSDFTISLWAKTASSANFALLSGARSSSPNELLMWFSNRVTFSPHIQNRSSGGNVTITAIDDDEWHHLVWTREGAENCLYIDAESKGCITRQTGELSIESLLLGQEQDSVGGDFVGSQAFVGLVDELLIFDDVLDTAEVTSIFKNQNAGLGYDGEPRVCPELIEPILNMWFDESAWIGAGQETIVDQTGNFQATAEGGANTDNNTPALVGNPGTCGYGVFDGNNDYVEIPHDARLSLSDELTISTWINPSLFPSGSNLKSILSKDENYEFHLRSTGEIFWWWRNGSSQIRSFTTSGANITLNSWYHITITYKDGEQIIYVNGVNRGETDYTGQMQQNSDPLQVGSDQNFGGRYFQGFIDEVRIYDTALDADQVDEIYADTHPCGTTIDHFQVDIIDGQGLTCEPDIINIKACSDASCTTVNADAVDVVLSLSNTNGVVLNKGVTVAGVSGVDVEYIHTTAEVISLSLDQTYECINGSPSDCDVTFSDAGFKFVNSANSSNLPIQLSGKPSNIGYLADTLQLEAVKTDDSGACAPLLITGESIDMAATYESPITGTQQVDISGTQIGMSDLGTVFDSLNFTSVPLDFGDSSQHSAEFIFTYPDAGSVVLNARYELPDDDGNPSGSFIKGSSSPIVVRPFAFDMFVDKNVLASDPEYKVNPGAIDASGDIFTVAADEIRVSSRAVVWELVDDSNADGIADVGADLTNNTTTANFTDVILTNLIHSKVAPVSGISEGVLSVTSGVFSSGTQLDIASYDEVGIISLDATYSDYLNSGENILGSLAYVGRFTPDHFTVTSLNDGEIWSTCNTTSALTSLPFAYSGQMLLDDLSLGSLGYSSTPGVVIEARNKDDVITQNYIGDFMKLTNLSFVRESTMMAGIEVFAPFEDATQLGKDLINNVRLDSLLYDDSFTDANGEISYTYNDADNFVYRHEENSEVIEFLADIDLPMVSIIDSDNIATVDFDSITSNGFIFTLNPTAPPIRFGRAQVNNSYGPDTADLPQILSVNYFTDTGYELSEDDTCTTYDSSNITLTNITLDPSKTPIKSAVSGQFSDDSPFGETHDIILRGPTNALTLTSTGQVCVTYDIFPWLQYQWAVDADNLQCAYGTADVDGLYNDNPHAVATFGLYRGNDRIIYQREISR